MSGPIPKDITNEIDVLVVGGGSASTIAAIQAGRAGTKTMVMARPPTLAA